MLYCDNCLQSITDKNGGVADYFEDGEICPFCQNGHLHAPWPDEVERFRRLVISRMSPEKRAERLEQFKVFHEKFPDKTEPVEIIALLSEGAHELA